MTANYVKRVVTDHAQSRGLQNPSVYVVGEPGLR
jgi:hypothetical protein